MTSSNILRTLRTTAIALAFCLPLSGCLTTKMYVDPTLPVVGKNDFPAATEPQPANVLFEFRTKGNINSRATQQVKPIVLNAVRESAMFSDVADATAPEAQSQLRIVIDNTPITENAAAKGFGTGLTMGLAGSLVTDGYVCTVSYTSGGVTRQATVKHAIHTTIGNHSGPDGLTAVKPMQAIESVTTQMVLNALKELAEENTGEAG